MIRIPPFRAPAFLLTVLLASAGLHAELTVASLSTITTDLAKNIGGDRVKVIEVIGSGVDPHEYQPTIRDVRRVADADLVLYTGKGMEGFLAKLCEAAGNKDRFVNVGSTIPSITMTEEGAPVEDPHWWHSVENMKRATRIVEDAFEKADPANAAAYGKNAAAYLVSLDELQRWIRVQLAPLPRSKRKLVTSHDALGYFARDYGFTILPVKGVSTGEEPSSKHVKELIGVIRHQGVKAYFLESIESDRTVNQIGSETGARAGGILYSDSLGATEASTYDSMMRHNVTTIVDGLK